jgi:hypothetical protein
MPMYTSESKSYQAGSSTTRSKTPKPKKSKKKKKKRSFNSYVSSADKKKSGY